MVSSKVGVNLASLGVNPVRRDFIPQLPVLRTARHGTAGVALEMGKYPLRMRRPVDTYRDRRKEFKGITASETYSRPPAGCG
jgi:hypothetical protein